MYEGTKFREHIHRALSTSRHPERRDEPATKHFLTKSHRRHGVPENITIDGSEANAAGQVALYFTLIGLGLAFSDVLTDAMMVENGQRLALTGPFQAVQWAAISAASVVVGLAGGRLAEHAPLALTFLISAIFPMISLGMGIWRP